MLQPNTEIEARGLRVVRWLGSGASGDVYEVVDTSTDERLALKVLREPRRGWIVGFKREFRLLADLRHPSLVAYHSLWTTEDQWFLLMDMVDGEGLWERCAPSVAVAATTTLPIAQTNTPLLESGPGTFELDTEATTAVPLPNLDARPDPAASDLTGQTFDDHPTVPDEGLAEPSPSGTPLPATTVALRRLPADVVLPIARGLAEALQYLHSTGHLHRDLKPRNIILKPDGTPVILDFGLVSARSDISSLVVGTPRYMAPECLNPPVGPPSDWFAFGLILYELLTGVTPLPGSGLSLVQRRSRETPAPPSDIIAGVPAALSALVVDLLQPRPEDRPSDPEICRRLGLPVASTALPQMPFVGRTQELAQLMGAADRIHTHGGPQVVRLEAAAGMGKSSLLRALRTRLHHTHPDTLVLHSRCHPQESLPHKALDGVIDTLALTLWERRLPLQLPRGTVTALCTAFPALDARLQPTPGSDPTEPNLDDAVQQLIVAASDGRGAIVVIDDAQWGDADSAALIGSLVERATPLLLILAHRDEAPGPFLTALAPMLRDVPLTRLGPLDRADAEQLAAVLSAQHPESETLDQLHAQTQGHPYLLGELLRVRQGAHRPSADLHDLLKLRVQELPPAALLAIRLVALAPRAIPDNILQISIPEHRQQLRGQLGLCRARRLLRTADVAEGDQLDVYHDRVREVVLADLSPDQHQALSLRLATAWSSDPTTDADVLGQLWTQAGELGQALTAWRHARQRSEDAHAHSHAAEIGRRILALEGATEADHRALVRALSRSGQRKEAAAHLQQLAQGSTGLTAAQDLRRAAEHLLRSGHLSEGMALFESLAARQRIPLVHGRVAALVRIVSYRVRVYFRGYGFTPAPQNTLDPHRLERAELAGALNRGLRFLRTLDGVVPSAINMLELLELGDTQRLPLSLANEHNLLAAAGTQQPPRTARLRQQTLDLVADIDDPLVVGTTHLELAGGACLSGDFVEASRLIEIGERLLLPMGDAANEQVDVRFAYLSLATWYTGDWAHLATQARRGIRDAGLRGDRWTRLWLQAGYAAVARVMTGRSIDLTRAEVENVQAEATVASPVLWCSGALTLAMLDVLGGQPKQALVRLDAARPLFHDSLLLQAQLTRGMVWDVEGRAALACVALGDDGAAGRAQSCRDALHREGVVWMHCVAHMLDAGLATHRGRHELADRALLRAQELATQAGMKAHLSVIVAALGASSTSDTLTMLTTLRVASAARPDDHPSR